MSITFLKFYIANIKLFNYKYLFINNIYKIWNSTIMKKELKNFSQEKQYLKTLKWIFKKEF